MKRKLKLKNFPFYIAWLQCCISWLAIWEIGGWWSCFSVFFPNYYPQFRSTTQKVAPKKTTKKNQKTFLKLCPIWMLNICFWLVWGVFTNQSEHIGKALFKLLWASLWSLLEGLKNANISKEKVNMAANERFRYCSVAER